MRRTMCNIVKLVILGAVVFAGCDDDRVNYASTTTEAGGDAAVTSGEDAASTTSDRDVGVDVMDPGVTETCTCVEGEVYRKGACVPTLELGCGPACSSDDACGPELSCLMCAASSDCTSKDCISACGVPNAPQAYMPDPLRISPTSGVAGEATSITVEGTAFYVGALGHQFRLGGDMELLDSRNGDICNMTVQLPPLDAGLYPVWASQYSGGEPWVMAGFFRVGDVAECVQPGFACGGALACCASPDIPTSCMEGRCRLTDR